jgi:hypothetical protein
MQTVKAPLVPQIYGDKEPTPDKSRYRTSGYKYSPQTQRICLARLKSEFQEIIIGLSSTRNPNRRADRRWNQVRNLDATKRGHRPKRSWRGSLLTTHSRGSARRSPKKRDECWKLRQLPLIYFAFKNISRSKEELWNDCMIIGIHGS